MTPLEDVAALEERLSELFDGLQISSVLNECGELAATVDDARGRAVLKRWTGRAHAIRGEHPAARGHYEAALTELRELGDAGASERCLVLLDLARLEWSSGTLGDALEFAARAEADGPDGSASPDSRRIRRAHDRARLLTATFLLSADPFGRDPGGRDARELIASVEGPLARSGAAFGDEFWVAADLATARALLAQADGELDRAVRELDQAIEQLRDGAMGRSNSHLEEARRRELLELQAALFVRRGGRGDLAAAERGAEGVMQDVEELADLDNRRALKLQRISVRLTRVRVALARGDIQAAENWQREASLLADGILAAPLSAEIEDLAGTIERLSGDPVRLLLASAHHAAAREGYERTGRRRQAALSALNLAIDRLLSTRVRQVRAAAPMIDEALAEFTEDDRETADALMIRVAVDIALGTTTDESFEQLERAGRIYAAQGTSATLDLAAARHNQAVVMIERAESLRGEGRRELLEAALELVIPAALARDAVRFSLATREHRGAWFQGHVRSSYAVALEICGLIDDASHHRLAAELVAQARLAGMTRSAEPAPTAPTAHRMGAAALGRTGADRPAVVLEPGPLLEMPWPRPALDRYRRLAVQEYGFPETPANRSIGVAR